MERVRVWVWISLLFLSLGAVACGAPPADEPADPAGDTTEPTTSADQPEDPATAYARAIEEAHGLDAWSSKDAVSARIQLTFGGNQALDGRMIFTPDMTKARLDQGEASVIWDGETAWVTPADAEFPRARFHVLTWPYFLAAPMKLRDPGTRLELLGAKAVDAKLHDAARLTFEEGVGDTPDDWYILYRDSRTNRLEAMAYVVTYGTRLEDANQEPHAIVYDDFQEVEGVMIPTTWEFRLWSEEKAGIYGDPLGQAKLSDVRFVTPEEGTFQVPDDAREVTLPQPTPADSEGPETSEES